MGPDSEQSWMDEEPPNMTGHLVTQRTQLGGVVMTEREVVTAHRPWLANRVRALALDPEITKITLEWRRTDG